MKPSFLKIFVFKTFSAYTKTQSRRFQIPPVWWAFRIVPFSWRISVDGRPNRRNKAAFSWRISVDGRPNRRNKALFSWRISVDGRHNRRNKRLRFQIPPVRGASFSWRISVDGRPNRRNKAAFSNSSGVVWTRPKCVSLIFNIQQIPCIWVDLNFNYIDKHVVFNQFTLKQQETFEVLIQIQWPIYGNLCGINEKVTDESSSTKRLKRCSKII